MRLNRFFTPRNAIKRISCGFLVFFCLYSFCACVPVASVAAPAAPTTAPLTQSQTARFTIESAAFGATVPFMIYLPKGYTTGERYPVWYAMHGYSSTEKMWLSDAGVGAVADSLIDAGTLSPMIMVFPYTRYDDAKTIEADMADGVRGPSRMEQFLCEELAPYLDAHYSTIPSSNGRFIGGFSMGGLFALQIGLHRPDLFGKIGAYSPALTYSDFSGDHFEQWLETDTNSAQQLDDYATVHGLDGLSIYLDCGGSSDPFSAGAASLYDALVARGISTEFHPHEGGHTLQKNLLQAYLLFYNTVPS
jgi:enterochelin esterase-like enzyme